METSPVASLHMVLSKNKNKKGADQAAWMRGLFCALVVRKPLNTGFSYEPSCDKTKKVACAPSKDSNQPENRLCLVRVLGKDPRYLATRRYVLANTLVRVDGCTCWVCNETV